MVPIDRPLFKVFTPRMLSKSISNIAIVITATLQATVVPYVKRLTQPDIKADMESIYSLQRIEAVRRWTSLSLSQDGGWTDFDEILGVNTLKRGLSIDTTFDPCHFSLDTIFKQCATMLGKIS